MIQDMSLIKEAYKGYTPQINVTKTIEILLEYVPPEDLAHLHSIVLTNTAVLSGGRKRKRSSSGSYLTQVLGRYHHGWKGQPAYIEIFVDNILKRGSWAEINIPMLRHWMFGKILYHEIGRHVQHMSNSKTVKEEAYAEEYTSRLKRCFSQQRYGHLRPLWKYFFWFIKKVGIVKLLERQSGVKIG